MPFYIAVLRRISGGAIILLSHVFCLLLILDTLHKTLPTCSAIIKLQFMFMQYIQVEIFLNLTYLTSNLQPLQFF